MTDPLAVAVVTGVTLTTRVYIMTGRRGEARPGGDDNVHNKSKTGD